MNIFEMTLQRSYIVEIHNLMPKEINTLVIRLINQSISGMSLYFSAQVMVFTIYMCMATWYINTQYELIGKLVYVTIENE